MNPQTHIASLDASARLKDAISQYSQAWTNRDLDAIVALHTHDSIFVLNLAGQLPVLGREEIRTKFQQILRGNPDYSSTVLRMSWGADFVVIEYRIHVQPTGQFFLGQIRFTPKDNVAYDIPAIDVIHVTQGLVSAKYTYVDTETVRANSVAASTVI
jgi:ketosteroid isomerase-like protein